MKPYPQVVIRNRKESHPWAVALISLFVGGMCLWAFFISLVLVMR